MIVDLERNDLSRVCEPGSVRWPELMAERELAGVDAPRLDRRGHAARGRDARGAPRGDLPRRVGHRRAEDRRGRPDRRARARRPRRVDGRARHGPAERRPRPRAHDPHVRGRGRPHPPLGRRRDRLGLRAGGGDRAETWVKARAAARRARRAAPRARARDDAARARRGGRGVVDPDVPVLHADDEALLRGRAAFETLRVYGGRPFRLDAHLDRLESVVGADRARADPACRARGARRGGARGRRASRTPCCASSGRPGARAARRSALALVSAIPPVDRGGARTRGPLVSLLGVRAAAPWLLGGVKSTSYAVNMAAEAEAKRRGADDAVFVDHDGIVLEGPVTNVWWRRGQHARHALVRARDPGRRHARRRCSSSRRSSGYEVEEGDVSARRAARRRRGVRLLVGARDAAGRRAWTGRRSRSATPLRRCRPRCARSPRAEPVAVCDSESITSPRWPATRSDWAGWRSRTACSSTARPPGAAPSGSPTGRSRSPRRRKRVPGAEGQEPAPPGPAEARRRVRASSRRSSARCPRRRCPFERPAVIGMMAASTVAVRAVRDEPRAAAARPRAGERAPLVRARARRAARRRARRLPRRRARLDRVVRARRAPPEGARALRLAPRRAAARDDRASATRSPRAPPSTCAGRRAPRPRSARSAASVELFGWMTRHPDSPLARALARPGTSSRRGSRPRSRADAQLEVAAGRARRLPGPGAGRRPRPLRRGRGSRRRRSRSRSRRSRRATTPTRTSTTRARPCSPTAAGRGC